MLTPTRVMQNVITGFASSVDVVKHNDVNETVVVSVTHFNLPVAKSIAYTVTRTGVVTSIAESEPLGKDGSASSIIFNNGTLWMVVSEAIPGGSGSTQKIDIYEYIGAFAPSVVSGGAVDQVARDAAMAAMLAVNALKTRFDRLLAALKNVCSLT